MDRDGNYSRSQRVSCECLPKANMVTHTPIATCRIESYCIDALGIGGARVVQIWCRRALSVQEFGLVPSCLFQTTL